MTKRHLAIPALLVALGATACGGSDQDDPAPAAATARPAATTAAEPAALPPELVGTWTTRLRKADAPPGLHLENPFTVTIAPNGGVDDAPSFTLADAQEALEGETSMPAVDGDTITLRHEGCFVEGSGYRFFDNVYRYAVAGDRLTFTVVENGCKDRHAEAILTSRPFTRRA
jgi:hypothetical protein